LNAERFFDFDKAETSYLKLVDDYPKSERRADALYNAALALENTQQYEAAAKQYIRYCELFPKRDDAPQVCFRAGVAYEKMGAPQKEIQTYGTFVQRYRPNRANSDRVVEADLKIAKAYEKLKQPREADKYYGVTVADFKKASNEKSAPYGAEAEFQLVEREFAKFRAVQITGDTKQQKNAIVKKATLLKTVEGKYKEILNFKQVDWTMASLYRIGQLYQSFAESIIEAPCPGEIKKSARQMGMTEDEVCGEYRVLLEEQASTVEDKAVVAYETAITRARELQVVNTWTKQTLVALNKLRRAQWPLQKDAKLYVDDRAVSKPPVVLADGKAARREVAKSAPVQAPVPNRGEKAAEAPTETPVRQ
ncbi:MAG: tetratricopeptide repeat protein, partial [Clostridia bacterium]|nr:tetratricopeptide repeat protein [Deltaproteobacteria bacterium]